MIKLFAPYIPRETIDKIKEVFSSGCVTQGPMVDEFEEEFKRLFHVEHAASVNSGSAALELAYDLIGLKKGDEVISTPLTCTATNLPLLRRGIKIVWADIEARTLCMDPLDLRTKLTPKTKAVVHTHLGGVQSNVGRLHIPTVADACQALGIFTSDYNCFSFQAIKHITTGDGGMLECMKPFDWSKAKLLRWFGINRERTMTYRWETYKTRMMTCEPQYAGYKYQMNDIDAAMGIVGLRHYPKVMEHRAKIFSVYKERLSKLDGITLVDGAKNVYWLATVIVNRRDDFAKMLFDSGIECNVVQIRNDIYKIFGGKRAELPTLDSIEDKYVSIPIGMHVSEDDANYICDMIAKGW